MTSWKQRSDEVIAPTYQRYPVTVIEGEGCRLTDDAGKVYVDFLAGIAVCNLGHSHPRVAEAVCDQAGRLFHVSNLFYTPPQVELAEWLTARSFADRVFFCNSGAEANEAAIKLVRRYFWKKAGNQKPERDRIIAMDMSFHGRTMATLSATGQDKVKKGFSPILDGFDFVPFNDLSALTAKIGPETAAVLVEPVQGEGGVRTPDPDYLKQVRQICNDAGILLVFDEIQTGIGRTGTLFAHEHYGVTPDAMTLAKALANGLPMGALLATEELMAAFDAGSHASTFGGTPLVSAAALATLRTLEEEGIIADCRETGAYFMEKLKALKSHHKSIVDVRGMGLLIGVELSTDGDAVLAALRDRGFLANCIGGKTLRFAPPLIIERTDIDAVVHALDGILAAE